MTSRWDHGVGEDSKMDTRIQHENEPSQGPSAFFWHAKDFATAHEVAAGA
jgi:hypothetical protein